MPVCFREQHDVHSSIREARQCDTSLR
jgi:hypothetical protein